MLSMVLTLLPAVHSCAQQADKLRNAVPGMTSDWRFDQDSLTIVRAALENQHDVDESAIHVINQEFTSNTISRIWHFSWRGRRLKISELSWFTHIAREDVQVTLSSLSYSVRTDSGTPIIEWSSETASGKTNEALIRPDAKGIVVDSIDPQGNKSHRVFPNIDAPYREAFKGMSASSLRVGQKDATVSYDIDSCSPRRIESIVTAVNHKPAGNPPWIASIATTLVDGTKALSFFDAKNHMVRLLCNGMEYVQCDPALAIQERANPAKMVSLVTPIDCWVLPGDTLTSLPLC
jgi:hypothetical protein